LLSRYSAGEGISVQWTASKDLTLGADMRVLLACAIIISAAIEMGGCFWHHQAAVVTQPAPPLK
jgi:hypothetical protein